MKYYLVWRESLELVSIGTIDQSALTNSLDAIYFNGEEAVERANKTVEYFKNKIAWGSGELGGRYKEVSVYVYEAEKIDNKLRNIRTIYRWDYKN